MKSIGYLIAGADLLLGTVEAVVCAVFVVACMLMLYALVLYALICSEMKQIDGTAPAVCRTMNAKAARSAGTAIVQSWARTMISFSKCRFEG